MAKFIVIFLTSFLLSVAYGATIYVNSTFLGQFLPSAGVSALFVLSSLGNILLFFLAPRLLRRFRKEDLLVAFLLFTGLGTLWLSMSTTALSAGTAFVIGGSFFFMAYYCLDISLEAVSSDRHTGGIRGLYWTFLNGGIALGPLLVSLLVKGNELGSVYAVAALLIFASIVSGLFHYRHHLKTPAHRKYHEPLRLPLRQWWRGRNVRAVTLARFSLEVFFAIMTIYTPIYLHERLGFTWSELGIIFTVVLLPFVLLEWPAGEAADRFWGEKEIMSVGFFLMGGMLLLMPFLGYSFAYWLVVLLVSRVGASLVEITTESYFFKKVSADDTGLIGIFRMTRPVSTIFGSTLGALIVFLLPFQAVFLVAAVCVFLGMKESLYLKDTL